MRRGGSLPARKKDAATRCRPSLRVCLVPGDLVVGRPAAAEERILGVPEAEDRQCLLGGLEHFGSRAQEVEPGLGDLCLEHLEDVLDEKGTSPSAVAIEVVAAVPAPVVSAAASAQRVSRSLTSSSSSLRLLMKLLRTRRLPSQPPLS